jgi:hypothetical protein
MSQQRGRAGVGSRARGRYCARVGVERDLHERAITDIFIGLGLADENSMLVSSARPSPTKIGSFFRRPILSRRK